MRVIETLKAATDAYVVQPSPAANYGKATSLALRTAANQNRRAFIYFPLDLAKLDGATVLDGILRVYLKTAVAGVDLTVRRVTQSWKEGTVNYNNQPATSAVNAGADTVTGAAGGYVEIDITALVQDWINGKSVYGIRIETDSATQHTIYSTEAQQIYRPTLYLEWTKPPATPADLKPSGEQAVTAAAPLLVWSGETPDSVQVQIDNATDFATPVFDSGWEVSADTAYDTALDGTPPSLTDDTTYYWRARILVDGVESEWSDVAEFQRRSKGVLSVTAPGATVEETTPTVSHTFTGRTQTAVEYLLYRDIPGVGFTNTYIREKEPQTDLDFELPEGQILSETETYRITVRVWDEYGRSGTDSVPYVEDSTDFTFAPTAGVAPVTDLAAESEDGHVAITWSRVATPDYFALRVDGDLVFDRIDPSEVALGGGLFAFDFFRAKPWISHEYVVEAVVDTVGVFKHSTSNPSVTAAFEPRGIWLLDEEAGIEIQITGEEDIGAELGESGQTFYPLGRQDPVRIVEQVRGLEGEVSGQIITVGTRESSDQRAALITVKSDPLATRRLVFGRRNIPVVIGELELSDLPEPEEMYDVGFDFWQIGEFEVEEL